MVFTLVLIMYFSNDIEHLFQVIIKHLYIFLCDIYILLTYISPFVLVMTILKTIYYYWLSGFVHMFQKQVLCQIYFFANIFLQSLVCWFIFLIMSFDKHTFLILMSYQIPIISFYSYSYLWCGEIVMVIPISWIYYSVSSDIL